jgi:succinate dehydrogenase / fumarate reductase, membrane anchor subunit
MAMEAKKHWLVLRATAVLAIPLCIWFVYSIIAHAGADYAEFTMWVKKPVNAVLLMTTIIISFYHAMLGVHEILEDYVHAPGLLKISMTLKVLTFMLVGAVCVFSIAKIAFLGG